MAGLKSGHFLVLNTRDRVSVSFLGPDLILGKCIHFTLPPAAGKKALKDQRFVRHQHTQDEPQVLSRHSYLTTKVKRGLHKQSVIVFKAT